MFSTKLLLFGPELVFSTKIFSGQIKDRVLRETLPKYDSDPTMRDEILSSLPVRVESTLNHQRARLLGNKLSGTDRETYDPSFILNTVSNGDKIIVLDSKNLPGDWYKTKWEDLIHPSHPDQEQLHQQFLMSVSRHLHQPHL